MADSISIEVNGITDVQRRLSLIERIIRHKTLLNRVGTFVQFSIKKRTLEGRDVSGRLFKPYSPKYKLFRQKHNRPVNTVDLTFTGSMLASMDFSINEKESEVHVFFLNTSDNSGMKNPKKAFFLNEERNFFALSREEIEEINDIVDNYYNYAIRRYYSRRG